MTEIRERVRHREVPAKVSPVDRMVSELDGTFYKLSEAATILKVSQITLRRLLKKEGVKAPSYEVQMGGIFVYLYTPEDIKELRTVIYGQPEKRR